MLEWQKDICFYHGSLALKEAGTEREKLHLCLSALLKLL